MSYKLDLSFKNCETKDIYKNICEFQNLLLKNAEEYIKDNLIFVRIDEKKDIFYNNDQIDKFISQLFKHHIWYCEEIQSLCIVWGSNVKEIDDWFDGYVYFQNSTDQDYEYKTWDFNKTLKKISNDIQSLSKDDFNNIFNEMRPDYWCDDEQMPDNDEYYRKTIIYELCEKKINPIWTDGFGVSFIDGALDQNKFKLRHMAIKLLIEKDPNIKDCLIKTYE